MPSESGDRKPARAQNTMASQPPQPRTDPLPCPRCASSNTKFCYFNNYNLSQPRYFCKGCRRYWTHGGTLRNIPFGGGTRKSSKRHRSCPSSTTTTTTSSSSSTVTHEPGPESKPEPISANPVSVLPVNVEMGSIDVNLNNSLPVNLNLNESYPVSGNFTTTLLNVQGPWSWNLSGYGLDEMGLGFGPTRVLPFPGAGYPGGAMGVSSVGCNNATWQMEDIENGGVVDGDCSCWPGLAISTPGKGVE